MSKKPIVNQAKYLELLNKCELYEAWLRAIDEYADFDVWFKDNDSCYQFVNKRFESVLGCKREQLIDKSPIELFDTERAARILAMDRKVLQEGGLQRVVPCDEGGPFEMHDERRFPIKDNNGVVIGLGCFAFEVTKYSLAEESLAQAQTLACLGNWRWSIKDHCLISCSDEFANILGCSISKAFELMHDRLQRVIHPDDQFIMAPYIFGIDRSYSAYRVEYRIIRPSGEVRYVQEIAEPLIGNSGEAVEYAGTLQDITERKLIEEELRCITRDLEVRVQERTAHLEFMASHDGLTGLLNRASFVEKIKNRLNGLKNNNVSLAIIVIDVRGLKGVNDCFGHSAGDEILISIAERLKNCLSHQDYIARLRGVQFGIAVFGLLDPKKNVEVICKRIALSIGHSITLEGLEFFISNCAGVHIVQSKDTDLLESIKFAEIALYRAKQSQESNVVIFENQMAEELAYHRTLESELHKAIENSDIYMAYQPQVDIATGQVVGYEALARWSHKKFGVVSPEIFITLAEDNGMINQLGEYILTESCKNFTVLSGFTPNQLISLSVNLSPTQFYNSQLVTLIKKVLFNTDIDPKRFEIEITESLFIKNPEHTLKILDQLRNMGIKISLDDFGTGYSSLSYLKKFNIDCIKIDRSFIKDINTLKFDQRIVEGIVSLAESLGIDTIAEGIETVEQLAYLKKIGCRKAQGFYLGKPVRIEEIPDAIKNIELLTR